MKSLLEKIIESMQLSSDNDLYCTLKSSECDAVLEELNARNNRIAELMAALESLRRTQHRECEDCWYSCPKSEGCCNDDEPSDKCDCGMDRQNAIIDTALKGVTK